MTAENGPETETGSYVASTGNGSDDLTLRDSQAKIDENGAESAAGSYVTSGRDFFVIVC